MNARTASEAGVKKNKLRFANRVEMAEQVIPLTAVEDEERNAACEKASRRTFSLVRRVASTHLDAHMAA